MERVGKKGHNKREGDASLSLSAAPSLLSLLFSLVLSVLSFILFYVFSALHLSSSHTLSQMQTRSCTLVHILSRWALEPETWGVVISRFEELLCSENKKEKGSDACVCVCMCVCCSLKMHLPFANLPLHTHTLTHTHTHTHTPTEVLLSNSSGDPVHSWLSTLTFVCTGDIKNWSSLQEWINSLTWIHTAATHTFPRLSKFPHLTTGPDVCPCNLLLLTLEFNRVKPSSSISSTFVSLGRPRLISAAWPRGWLPFGDQITPVLS